MHVIISMHITPADEQDHKLQFHEENHTYMVNFKFKRILNNCLHFSSFSRHNIILIIVITIILFSSFLIKSQTLNFIKNMVSIANITMQNILNTHQWYLMTLFFRHWGFISYKRDNVVKSNIPTNFPLYKKFL